MARPSRRSSRPRRETWYNVLGVGLVVASLAVLGALAYWFQTAERPPPLDQATYCPRDGARSATVALIDASDELSAVTRAEVTKLLTDDALAVARYGLFEMRVLDPAVPGGRVIFSRCNPGDGAGLSEFTGNPQLARKRWVEAFQEPLARALAEGLRAKNEKTSPIMATIQGIAVDRFAGAKAATIDKRLIVVSDMIEHGPEYTQYSGGLSFERYRRSPAYKRFSTDLQRAAVKILYVQRLRGPDGSSANHAKFWMEWIKDNRGGPTEAIRLQGAS